jgi:FkbM family methyltransferase
VIVELATRNGTMFVPDTDAGQYWWLANTGASPEDEFIEAICGLLEDRPRGTAVDVGANFGCWTLALAGYAHRVVAVEPQPGCYELLMRSVLANGLSNVRGIHAAAGAKQGSVRIPVLDLDAASNFGGVSVAIAHHEQPDAPMVDVPVRRLDDLLRGEQVSFIKIDVEGFEANVVAGAVDTMRRCKPILFVEMDHELTDADALCERIESFGYATEKRGGNFLGLPL